MFVFQAPGYQAKQKPEAKSHNSKLLADPAHTLNIQSNSKMRSSSGSKTLLLKIG